MSVPHQHSREQAVDPPTATAAVRLGWLDALRGIAVLLVLYEHITWHVLTVLRRYTEPWFDAGRTGVFLFFIISGYIVPASLERRGSLRGFWLSRIFRLYPLFILATAAALVLVVAGLTPADPTAVRRTTATVLASATMLQDMLTLPSTPAVLWSLSYEMIFYLLISALFAVNLHRWSAGWALLFTGAAVTMGGVLPVSPLSVLGIGVLGAAVALVVTVVPGVAGMMSGRHTLVLAGAACVAGASIALLATSGTFRPWHTLSIPAIMFTGTVLYRAERGQLRWRIAGPVVAIVFVGINSAIWWDLPDLSWRTLARTGHWVGSVTLAAGLFAAGMALRRSRFPAPLIRLGLISYSFYVVHFVLVLALDDTMARSKADIWVLQAAVGLAFTGLAVACAEVSYRFVELPAQRLGRRLTRAMDRRWGDDTATPSIPRPAPASGVSPPGLGQAENEASASVS